MLRLLLLLVHMSQLLITSKLCARVQIKISAPLTAVTGVVHLVQPSLQLVTVYVVAAVLAIFVS